MSTEKNKKEVTGAAAPVAPSKVEGTQSADQAQLDLGAKSADNESLASALAAKDSEIEALKAEHQNFKDKLKPEIEKIQEDNKTLKAENESLKGEIEALKADTGKSSGKGSKGSKTEGKSFIVSNSFRGNKEGEGIFNINDDVTHFEADRLKDLVERGLVEEVK